MWPLRIGDAQAAPADATLDCVVTLSPDRVRIAIDAPPVPPLGDPLVGPDDASRDRRLTWSVLMRRTWGFCVLICPRCSGSMRLVAAIEHPATIHRILSHLGIPTRAPPRGPPWRAQRDLALDRRADEYDGVDAPAFAD